MLKQLSHGKETDSLELEAQTGTIYVAYLRTMDLYRVAHQSLPEGFVYHTYLAAIESILSIEGVA